jgi:hypothetical protein
LPGSQSTVTVKRTGMASGAVDPTSGMQRPHRGLGRQRPARSRPEVPAA